MFDTPDSPKKVAESPAASGTPSPTPPTSIASAGVSVTPSSDVSGTPPASIPVKQEGPSGPEPGKLRLSESAIYFRMRRVFHPQGGKKKVSDEMVKRWDKGGKSRQNLMKVFQACGYQPVTRFDHDFSSSTPRRKNHPNLTFNLDPKSLAHRYQEEFVTELEILNSDILENNLTVEGEYVSESTMETWGWNKFFGVNEIDCLSFSPLALIRSFGLLLAIPSSHV